MVYAAHDQIKSREHVTGALLRELTDTKTECAGRTLRVRGGHVHGREGLHEMQEGLGDIPQASLKAAGQSESRGMKQGPSTQHWGPQAPSLRGHRACESWHRPWLAGQERKGL